MRYELNSLAELLNAFVIVSIALFFPVAVFFGIF
jgi:hypothetical protein